MKIKKGLDIPIAGYPRQQINYGPTVREVALVGEDYHGLKPTMEVQAGDRVKEGQLLFTDKKNPGVRFTSPASGEVSAIHRGEKRRFLSMTIQVDGEEAEQFEAYSQTDLQGLTDKEVRLNLIQSGLWTAFRTRPYSKIPGVNDQPRSIFVTAIDTAPLAANPQVVIEEHSEDFTLGLHVVGRLCEKVFLCRQEGAETPGDQIDGVTVAEFSGPHPAGLPGTHIHFLDPVGPNKTVWHVNYQDVIAFGKLFREGRLMTERVAALGGPLVQTPRLLRTRLGACLDDLVKNELRPGKARVVSGTVLSGRASVAPVHYLGRYHQQISVLEEGDQREFLGWQKPGFDKFSVTRAFASYWTGGDKRFDLNTSTGGSRRSMVPIGTYERVMPLDILPTHLLRSLIVDDTEQAQALGCLELDEEDLALCTFVCPGKYEYGPILRRNLAQIEREG